MCVYIYIYIYIHMWRVHVARRPVILEGREVALTQLAYYYYYYHLYYTIIIIVINIINSNKQQ